MMRHRIYTEIVYAIREGRLHEPFSIDDFRHACKGFAESTYKAFLYKHSKYNFTGESELFLKVGKNKFKLLKPIKYDL